MSGVIIGSARIDENGKISGGSAGDQTAKEVSTQNWYIHNKGWIVLRPKNFEIANLIADDMVSACDNNNIGYDQNQRNTLYKDAEKVGFNCALVTKKCETDCSALVRVCCAYAGIRVPDFNTSNEVETLMKSGQFEKLTQTKYTTSEKYLKRGDILVTKTKGHTVIVLTNGPKAEFNPGTDYVYINGNAVYIRQGPGVVFKAIGIAHKSSRYPFAGLIENGWYQIYYGSGTAWISGKYSQLL